MDKLAEKAKSSIHSGLVRGLLEMHRGQLGYEVAKKLDPTTKIEFDIFRMQLRDGTWDYEGIRQRLELFCTLVQHKWHTAKRKAWEDAFYETSKDELWEIIRIGLYYMCNSKLKPEGTENPLLAALYTPFCIAYHCPYRNGCMFTIAEDLLGLFHLALGSGIPYIDDPFREEVAGFVELGEIIKPICEYLRNGQIIPTHIGREKQHKKEDVLVTLLVLSYLLNSPISGWPKRTKELQLKAILDRCCTRIKEFWVQGDAGKESPSYLAHYSHKKEKMLSVADDSPATGLQIGRALLNIWSQSASMRPDDDMANEMIAVMLSRACEAIEAKELGPTYGRDRYSGIGRATLSEIPTIIAAAEFLLDLHYLSKNEHFAFKQNGRDPIKKAIEEATNYLISSQKKNGVWPIVHGIDRLQSHKPRRKGAFWDATCEFDSRLVEHEPLFNVSFSNTLNSIQTLIRAIKYLGER